MSIRAAVRAACPPRRKRALFIIACNHRNIPAIRELNAGRDMVAPSGFFEHRAGYHRIEIVQDKPRADVLSALDNVVRRLDLGDLLVVYFCGHGRQFPDNLLVLPPGPGDGVIGFLPLSTIRRCTEGYDLERAMILDCCRTGDARTPEIIEAATTFTRRLPADLQPSRDVGHRPSGHQPQPTPPDGKGTLAILHACSDEEQAPKLGTSGKGLFSPAVCQVIGRAHDENKSLRLDDDLCD